MAAAIAARQGDFVKPRTRGRTQPARSLGVIMKIDLVRPQAARAGALVAGVAADLRTAGGRLAAAITLASAALAAVSMRKTHRRDDGVPAGTRSAR
jgi:hypothetical protein